MKRWLLILLMAGLAVVLGCENRGDPPVLSVPPVDLSELTSFIPFGDVLPGSGTMNPGFEYHFADHSDLEVLASAPGVVTEIVPQEEGGYSDFQLWTRPSKRSYWAVVYSHVMIPSVEEGDMVYPGDILGRVGYFGTMDRTVLSVQYTEYGNEAWCPLTWATYYFISEHKAVAPGPEWCMKGWF